jgi:hypothetical protein
VLRMPSRGAACVWIAEEIKAARMTGLRNVFPGVPLVESPVFKTMLETAGFSDEERRIAEDLNRDGFAVFEFPEADFDARVKGIRERLSPQLGIDQSQPASNHAESSIGRIQDAWSEDEDVRAIASNPAVLDLLSKLYGRRAFPFQTLNFPVGTQQHSHTDIVHFSSIPERFMCGVWVAMEDVHPGAGPLCYVPGSHKWPVISNTMIARRGWQSELDSAQTPYHDAWAALIGEHGAASQQLLARKGQALIWCANLLHGGSPRIDPFRTRWSQVSHYFFHDCLYYTPAFSDEPLGCLALREIIDISTGSAVPNLYLGEEVHAPIPPGEAESAKRGWSPFRKQRGRQSDAHAGSKIRRDAR